MAFTGKATYSAGADLPELAEDVSDIIGIVSPYETHLLDHLGDAARAARSTVHEWLEDSLNPNTDTIDDDSFSPNPQSATTFDVAHGARFQIGDQVRPGQTGEVMLVAGVAGNTLAVQRGYGGTTPATLADGMALTILGNAALEGADRPDARFTSRVRRSNFTQILTASVEVSGSQLASRAVGVADELDYQKQERIRELLRDLENCVINGVAPTASQQGDASTRRTMRGILSTIETNRFLPGEGPMPDGTGGDLDELDEGLLNAAIRAVWEQSAGHVDTIVVNGAQKRRINSFISGGVSYAPGDASFRELVSVYESDYGVARVVLSRWVPRDSVVLLDSSRIDVLPLAGRSFHFKRLASSGDSEVGQVIGEYTLEMRNENAHAVLSGLAV